MALLTLFFHQNFNFPLFVCVLCYDMVSSFVFIIASIFYGFFELSVMSFTTSPVPCRV